MSKSTIVADYLERVAAEASDRPRALAAAILARALRRPPDAEPGALSYVESEVLREASGDDETAAEVVYEVGSILVELRERFPDTPVALTGL